MNIFGLHLEQILQFAGNIGWIPPSEIQGYRDKWRYYQNLPLRQLDDAAKEQYEQVLRKAKVMRIK